MPDTPVKNKINFGLTKIAYAPVTAINAGVYTYGTPVVLNGSRSVQASKNGEKFKEWADGAVYFVTSNNSGYNLVVELVQADEDFRAFALGEQKDTKNVQLEYGDSKELPHFALLVEFEGDQRKTRRVFYDCTADRPDITGTTYKDNDSLSSYRDSISIDCTPRPSDKLVTAFTRADTDSTEYDDWFNGVYEPTL